MITVELLTCIDENEGDKICWEMIKLNHEADEDSQNAESVVDEQLVDDCHAYIDNNPVRVKLLSRRDGKMILKVCQLHGLSFIWIYD